GNAYRGAYARSKDISSAVVDGTVYARRHFGAERNRTHDGRTMRPHVLANVQGNRDDHRSVVPGAIVADGIDFVAVTNGPIRKRGIGKRCPEGVTYDAALTGRAERADQIDDRLARWQHRSGDHASNLIVEQRQCFLSYCGRKVITLRRTYPVT